jgi:predicted CoA-binding protein
LAKNSSKTKPELAGSETSLSEEDIKSVLTNHKTIAVVGLSRNPAKDSYQVAKYLKSAGYRIIPVNPFADRILGKKCYKSLLDIPETIEIVDIFRPSEDVLPIVKEAIQLKNRVGTPKLVWMQLGIANEEAEKLAIEAGLTVVMDKCIRTEHRHLSRNGILDR